MIGPTLRYALRSLRKNLIVLIFATVSLALGIGLSTTTFAALDALANPPALRAMRADPVEILRAT